MQFNLRKFYLLFSVVLGLIGSSAFNVLAITELDVSYVPHGVEKQKLDLYLPDAKNFPTILFIHGGGLTEGDRKDAPLPQIGAAFQKSGIGFAVMSYRLAPQNKWASQPEDAAAAFAWLKQYINERGGNNQRIFIAGHSSGALLTALLGTDEKYLRKYKLTLQDIAGCIPIGSLLTDTFKLKGVSQEKLERLFQNNSYLNIFGNLENLNDSIPFNHINKNMPQFLILIAEAEQFQPPILTSAQEFVTAAKKVDAKVEIEILKDRNHYGTINKMPEVNDPTFLRIVIFIKEMLQPQNN